MLEFSHWNFRGLSIVSFCNSLDTMQCSELMSSPAPVPAGAPTGVPATIPATVHPTPATPFSAWTSSLYSCYSTNVAKNLNLDDIQHASLAQLRKRHEKSHTVPSCTRDTKQDSKVPLLRTKKRKRPRRVAFNGSFSFQPTVTLEEISEMILKEKLVLKQDLKIENLNVQEKKKRTNKVWKRFYTWYDDACSSKFDDFLYPRNLLKRAFDHKLKPSFSRGNVQALCDLLIEGLESSEVSLSENRYRLLRNRITESRIIYQSYLDFTECKTADEFHHARGKWLADLSDPTTSEIPKSAKEELIKKLNKYKWK